MIFEIQKIRQKGKGKIRRQTRTLVGVEKNQNKTNLIGIFDPKIRGI